MLDGLKRETPYRLCAGNMNWKVAPTSVFGVPHSRPPCASTIERLMAKPMPMPSAFVNRSLPDPELDAFVERVVLDWSRCAVV